MNAHVEIGQTLDRYKDSDTSDRWYIVFTLEDEQVTYGPFLTEQEATDDMPRVLDMYTSLQAIG